MVPRFHSHPLGDGFVYEDRLSNPWGCQAAVTCGLCGERYQLVLKRVGDDYQFRCRRTEWCGRGIQRQQRAQAQPRPRSGQPRPRNPPPPPIP